MVKTATKVKIGLTIGEHLLCSMSYFRSRNHTFVSICGRARVLVHSMIIKGRPHVRVPVRK
jgi:hypothetical protein